MLCIRTLCLTSTYLLCVTAYGQEATMQAHFISVGQGLAVLLEFPCGAVLIDTGAQDDEHVDLLVDYLTEFFARRTDLSNTLSSVIITHPHIDHTRGLRKVATTFNVLNYVDDGETHGSGKANVRWIRQRVADGELNTHIREVFDSEVLGLPHRRGLSDDAIDPVNCAECDPKIVILSGNITDNPGWPEREFDNLNNHSLVVRVDFGESSFLFTGDLEEPAIDTLIDYYAGTEMLDVDVYQVGHHGSHNATTQDLVDAMTPEVAVMGVGRWNFGIHEENSFNTFSYGHPRRIVVDMLSAAIPGLRSAPIDAMVANGVRSFSHYAVSKRIYATGWDGTVIVVADKDGNIHEITEVSNAAPVPFAAEAPSPEPGAPQRLAAAAPCADCRSQIAPCATPHCTVKKAPQHVQRQRMSLRRHWRRSCN